jgi:hypothetical protein
MRLVTSAMPSVSRNRRNTYIISLPKGLVRISHRLAAQGIRNWDPEDVKVRRLHSEAEAATTSKKNQPRMDTNEGEY